jgi:sugar phosphate isomerase/epimerase
LKPNQIIAWDRLNSPLSNPRFEKHVNLSVATILWGKLRSTNDFGNLLSNVKGIGFDGIGFETRFLPSQILRKPDLIPEMVESVGLENVGSYSSMKQSDIEFAIKSKTPLLWVVVRREKTIKEAIKTLTNFAKRARDSSVVPALHNHIGTCFETGHEIAQALDKVEHLKLCFDTAHAEAANIDSLNFIRKYCDKIALVHLKDLRRKVTKSKISFTKDFVNVGSGIVDFQTVISNLRECGYNGPLMLELDAAKEKQPNQLASEGYSRIANLVSTIQ